MPVEVMLEEMRSNRGFTITEVIIGIGIVSIVGLTGVSALRMSQGLSKKATDFKELNDIKTLIQEHFESDRAIRNSIARQASMSCLDNDNQNCGPNTRGFQLFNAHRNSAEAVEVIEVRQGPGLGLTLDGKPCNTFPVGPVPYNQSVHRGCLLRYVTTWTPICGSDSTRCRLPSYRLNARLESAMGPQANVLTSQINLSQYNVEIVRDARGETAQAICNSLTGGAAGTGWNPTTRTCVLGMNQSCPAGQIFVGMNANNQKICRALNALSCPRGSVILSIATDGTVTCARGCYLNVSCTFNPWTGANSCPSNIGWVSGRGIMGTHPGLSPWAFYTPPPPPPDGGFDGDSAN